ncbi:hypothetical protein K3728_07440 [Rhodobacteraceae bacterium M385]|nr:hypothetical protein K3728_07440 [Rhodobacteraceae bacterium M385]
MQWLYVLRGTLVAYVFGVLLVAIPTLIDGGEAPGAIWLVAFFGLFALIPLQTVVFVIWGIFAKKQTLVTYRHAMGICAGVFFGLTFLSTLADGEFLVGLVMAVASPIVGAIFGGVFWVGAFGFRKEMQMGKEMQVRRRTPEGLR